MLTIRQIADLGIMPEHALRQLVKENQILHVKIGNKVLINYTALCEQLNRPPIIENIEKG
jgi:excisionase family DNA binding protein